MGLAGTIFKAFFRGIIPVAPRDDELPDRRKNLRDGFYWADGDLPPLAAGRALSQAVAGESFYRDNLSRLTGGPTKHGVTIDTGAQLRRSEWRGEPSIEIWIDGLRVGSIPADAVDQLLAEMDDIGVVAAATAKAQITAGYVGGDYRVQLSLSRPLKLRRESKLGRLDAG